VVKGLKVERTVESWQVDIKLQSKMSLESDSVTRSSLRRKERQNLDRCFTALRFVQHDKLHLWTQLGMKP